MAKDAATALRVFLGWPAGTQFSVLNCFPLQGIASLHWVCQGVPNAPANFTAES